MGWQAYIRVNGRLYAKRFPRDTQLGTMKDWRQSKRVEIKTDALIVAEEAAAEPPMEED